MPISNFNAYINFEHMCRNGRAWCKWQYSIPVQTKVTELQIKSISLNLPTKYLRRYAKQYHFIFVQIKVTEPQMICLYKTNQRGGSGDTTLLNKSCKRKLPSHKLNLYLLICQRSICGDTPPKIKSQKIKRNFFMFFIKSADKTIFLWYNYTNLKFYSEREMCYIYDLWKVLRRNSLSQAPREHGNTAYKTH